MNETPTPKGIEMQLQSLQRKGLPTQWGPAPPPSVEGQEAAGGSKNADTDRDKSFQPQLTSPWQQADRKLHGRPGDRETSFKIKTQNTESNITLAKQELSLSGPEEV